MAATAVGFECMDRTACSKKVAAASPAIWMVFPATMESRLNTFRCGVELLRITSDQFHLLGLGGRDADALDAAVGRVQDFELQTLVFDDFAFLRNPAGDFAD